MQKKIRFLKNFICIAPFKLFNYSTKICCLFQNITVDVTVPPTFIKKPSNQNCPNGRTARFECQAEGVPTPKIYWLKDAKNVTINGGTLPKKIHYHYFFSVK